MVKGRDLIYKLYIVPILTRKLSPIALYYSPAAGVVAYLILNLGDAAMTILFLKTHQTDIDRWGEIDDIV